MNSPLDRMLEAMQKATAQGFTPCCFVGVNDRGQCKAFGLFPEIFGEDKILSAIAQVMVGDIDPTLLP